MLEENSPTLYTNRLILRRFTLLDAPAMLELLHDPVVNTYLPWFPVTTLADTRAFLQERFLCCDALPSSYIYAICLKDDPSPIGYVDLSPSDSHDLGYGLKKEYWHKGIVTEAAAAVVSRIKAAGYPFITATHDRNNPRSGEVMRKIGMKYQYSYLEQWQPKDFPVIFRLYQLNFDEHTDRVYTKYRLQSVNSFVEPNL